MPNLHTSVRYCAGLDIGQAGEFTALAVVEQTYVLDSDSDAEVDKHYAVRHLHRFAVGTPYAEVAEFLRPMFAAPPLKGSTLVADVTAVGKPVHTLLRRADIGVHVIPVSIAAGHHAGLDGHGGWLIPRTELVSHLQILLQSRRLKVAPTLPDASLLMNELTNFKMKVTVTPLDALAAWREGVHDDLVFAVGIAVWHCERQSRFRLWVA